MNKMKESRLKEILKNRKGYEPSYGFTNLHSELGVELRDDLLRKVIEENKRKEENKMKEEIEVRKIEAWQENEEIIVVVNLTNGDYIERSFELDELKKSPYWNYVEEGC